jgi:HEAT repeat protein
MDELVRSLEDGTLRPTPRALSDFLSHLRSGALAPLLRAAERTEVKDLQPVLREAVLGIAKGNPRALAPLLSDADPVVVAGAARLVGRMGVMEAGPALADLMGHPAVEVRLAAIDAARDLKASTAAGALADALFDLERDVRVAAARALGHLRYRPAANDLAELIQSKEVRSADLTEKIAFFESYGILAGEAAVSPLDKLLNGRGFLGRKEAAEIRACAALALGKVGTPAARSALQTAASDDDPVVRSSISRALRGEEGGDA